MQSLLRRRGLGFLSFALLIVLNGLPASFQPYFSDCLSRTATNATILLPESFTAHLNDHAPDTSLEIAVFTSQDQCVGRTTWEGEPTSLTVWGTNDASTSPVPTSDGLAPGDSMYIRLFHPDTGTEYNHENSTIRVTFRDDRSYLSTNGRYEPDAIFVLETLRVESPLLTREE